MERPQSRVRSDDGFTLVELLVVMVIIGILAAIAVPTLLSQKRKASEAAVKSDVQAIARAVAAFYVDGSGLLAFGATADPLRWELKTAASVVVAAGQLSPGNAVSAASSITSDSSYCVAVVPSTSGASSWKATQDGLALGGCP